MNYVSDYAIYTPRLKSGNGYPVRINENLGDFTYDFSAQALEKFGLNAVSFCFFILWDRGLIGNLNREIWLKKELSIAGTGCIDIGETGCFDEKFFANEPLSELRRKRAFFDRYGLNASYLVIRDLKNDFHLTPDQNVALRVEYDEDRGRLKKTPITLSALQESLVRNSKKRMVIRKPLNYYETDLEKYLQTTCTVTGALFPGDCDMLLYDRDNRCKYIVEFKKTTSRDPRPVEEQSFLDHIDRDRNKYTRLNILRNFFSAVERKTVPFVTVFYSVKGENRIRIERIHPDLWPEKADVFDIGRGRAANQELILQKIIELCE